MKRNLIVVIMTIYFFLASQVFALDIKLDVPFISQVPPGSWSSTKNCGQTSALIVAAYFIGLKPYPYMIEDIDDFMYAAKIISPQSGVNKYNGNNTNANQIVQLLKDFQGFIHVEKSNSSDMKRLENLLSRGYPVIVAVRINMGKTTYGHFMVLVGMTDTHVIVHDPGRSLASGHGKHKYYTKEQFKNSWATQNYASIVAYGPTAKWHAPGTLVKLMNNPHDPTDEYRARTYLRDNNNQIRWITTEEIFYSSGYEFLQVVPVSKDELACYSMGPDISQPAPKQMAYVADDQLWYSQADSNGHFTKRKKVLLPEVLLSYGIQYDDVLHDNIAWQYYYNSDMSGVLYFRDGTLVKETSNPAVSVVYKGLAHHIFNWDAFLSLNYDEDNIIQVEPNKLSSGILGIDYEIDAELVSVCQGTQLGGEYGNEPDNQNNQDPPSQDPGNVDNPVPGTDDQYPDDQEGQSPSPGTATDPENGSDPPAPDQTCDPATATGCEPEGARDNPNPGSGYCSDPGCDGTDNSRSDPGNTSYGTDGTGFDRSNPDEQKDPAGCFSGEAAPECADVPGSDEENSQTTDNDAASDPVEEPIYSDDPEGPLPWNEIITCVATCPIIDGVQLSTLFYYGANSEIWTQEQPVVLQFTKAELCERGTPWIDINCVVDPWQYQNYKYATVSCDHEFIIHKGLIDAVGEGEIYFTDLECYPGSYPDVAWSCGKNCLSLAPYYNFRADWAVVTHNFNGSMVDFSQGQWIKINANYTAYQLDLTDVAPGSYQVEYYTINAEKADYSDPKYLDLGPYRNCQTTNNSTKCWIEFSKDAQGNIMPTN